MSSDKSIVILYSELAGYVLSCFEALGKTPGVNLLVVHWPIKTEAPFRLPTSSNFKLRGRSNMSREDIITIVDNAHPDLVIVSGWMDEDYLAVAKIYKSQIPVVLTIDNHWVGNLKQWFAVVTAPIFIKRLFNCAWVPGVPQTTYVKKLGFASNNIKNGFYSADTTLFNNIYRKREKTTRSKKKLLYIGRYLELKGIIELWDTFMKLSPEYPEWELHCVGAGELYEERASHPQIFHHDFLQPNELTPLIETATAFVMPSQIEPWGVVLHEMAAAGLPLIASDAVGATTMFLNPGENGWIYPSGNISALFNAFKELFNTSDSDLDQMGRKSHQLASRLTPEIWAETAHNFLLCNKLKN